MKIVKKKGGVGANNWRDILFYIGLMAFPVLQFIIFYVVVNTNSLSLTFKQYDTLTGNWTWVGVDNLKEAFRMMTQSSDLLDAMKNSFLMWGIGLLIGTPLALLFSYYIHKKMFGHKFFRVLLFMPSIISAIIMVTIYQFFVNRAIPEIMTDWFHSESFSGLVENPNTRFGAIMFYNILMSFGVSVLMYSDAMGNISPEMIEAAKLEGVTGIKEFIFISFPMIYPTFTTFLITGIAGIFTNQWNLFSSFGGGGQIQTFGYWLYVQTSGAASEAEYPVLAAIGFWLTLIAVPMVLVIKKLVEKFGPKED